MKVWLADLTYTQQSIASDVVPAAIGMIAEFTRMHMPSVRFEIFKFPEDLAAALDRGFPDVLGLSNYIWNSQLSLAFARRVKRVHPDTVIVMGGPNFPTIESEQEAFLRQRPWIDYYVMKEGELAFLRLLECLRDSSGRLIPPQADVPNVVYIDETNRFVPARHVERVMDLQSIPSPYLSGTLDFFLDGRLLPVIQTNRGCPFACTFCTEGQSYWNKVRHKASSTIAQEIRYISDRMARLPADRRRSDLLIADSNFGMFSEDLDTCRVIAEEQRSHGYPRYINVATGKNKKERVLEAARLVGGAMKLAGSVQSLDPTVLANIKRQNISASQILDLALKAAEIGTNTYSEVILALPGDTLEAHFRTLELLVDAGFNTIAMYQLMILPGTELGLESTKAQHAMTCKYRVVPRCFGTYRILGEPVAVAEIEEICVANATLPYDDYLAARRMNLIVNIFYNDGVFAEFLQLLSLAGVSRWAWLKTIYSTSYSEGFDQLIADFLKETEDELWECYEDLQKFVAQPEIIERYIAGDLGSNLMFKYKAISMTERFGFVCDVALASIRSCLLRHAPERAELLDVADDIASFKRHQIENLFHSTTPRRHLFRYDVPSLSAAIGSPAIDVAALRYARPTWVEFTTTDDQRRTIESYVNIFGNDIPGLTRILSRIYLRQLFRVPTQTTQH